ncbi:hypothetical protein EJ04DRAFT_556965 [Polyplosphaeria fusca]|uniref:DUF6594 domain-containing protein n=1 Tax=Polyplosphaeria fusca TaxID=682080 RepID=A0A9P4QIU1_9PLEO|nr:hypothetical protein EJ04DRAFT_556965 [Polyplosphaeria fusca]
MSSLFTAYSASRPLCIGLDNSGVGRQQQGVAASQARLSTGLANGDAWGYSTCASHGAASLEERRKKHQLKASYSSTPSASMFFTKTSERKSEHDSRNDFLNGLAKLPYHERITRFLRGAARHWVAGGISVVDFRPLYSVTLHDLQRQLAGEIQKIEGESVTDDQLICQHQHRQHRAAYPTLYKANALRDFEFIHANRWSTQFVKDIAASRIDNGGGSKLQGALISELNLTVPDTHRSLFRDADLLGSFNPKLMEHSNALGQSLGTTRAHASASEARRAEFAMAWTRFAFAFLGGLIIIVPMLILLVGSVKTKTLAVIPTSIFLFAVGVALFAKTDPVNLLAATAAYAAVLTALIKP